MYQGKPMGIVSQNDSISWAVFRPESRPGSSAFVTSGPIPFEPSLKERDRAQSLLDRVSGESIPVQPFASHNVQASRQPSHGQAPASVPKTGGCPHILIEAAGANTLCQLLGQVVKLNTYDSEKTLLYLTDYTQNESLNNYKKPGDDDDSGPEGDRFNFISRKGNDWQGPWGRLTIMVTLWEPHASYAREKVQAGDIVMLTYTRIKQGQYGIEAAVHEDRKYPEKIHVRKLIGNNDERVQALMERRTAYWKIHGEPKAETKKAKKRNKKVEQKKEARKEEGQLMLPAASRIKLNPHGESIICLRVPGLINLQ
jgi:protection-of-telomeres protein 1